MPQNQVLLPQHPLQPLARVLQNPLRPQPPLLQNPNPNLIVSTPRHEQLPLASNPSSPSTALPAVSSFKILKSNQVAKKPTHGEFLHSSLSAPPACPTDKDGTCVICKDKHAVNRYCIDIDSEISLRLAMDTLRTSGDQPLVQAFRTYLANQLRRLSGS
ncbi:hypothetical protein F4814DRAFT_428309 [Daldinia grandis]|nr:hypothetical protein F4814DRAFT_428309 [Daldinia grandis]